MTHYPSPWPAAIATMVAALLVGSGTVAGVWWTVRNARTNATATRDHESDEREADRRQALEAVRMTLDDAAEARAEERAEARALKNFDIDEARTRRFEGQVVRLWLEYEKVSVDWEMGLQQLAVNRTPFDGQDKVMAALATTQSGLSFLAPLTYLNEPLTDMLKLAAQAADAIDTLGEPITYNQWNEIMQPYFDHKRFVKESIKSAFQMYTEYAEKAIPAND